MFQLSFLNVTLLFFAVATILPLIIWLLAKKKPPQIIFSTIRFIRHTEKEQKSRTQIKNILLLIIRMLIILLVILAAARPSLLVPHGKPSKNHPATAVAVLLDTSYSMDYTSDAKSTLEYAKAALQEINKRTTSRDMVCLVTSDDGWNRMNSQLFAGQIPESLIGSLHTTWQPLNLDKMLEFATDKLKSSQLSNREIYILTDFQAQPLPAAMDIPVMFIPIPKQEDWNNITCQDVKPLLQLTNKQQTQTIGFTLFNHGKTVRKDVLVSVEFNGVKAAEKFVTLQPEQKLTDQLPVQITASGWQNGYVEVLDEKLTADNRSYFAFPYELHPALAVITERNSLPSVMQSILSVYATPGGSVKLINPQQVSLQSLNSYNFLAVYAAGELTLRMREFIGDWNKAGKGILLCANKDLDSGWKTFINQMYGINTGQFITTPQPISYLNPYNDITSVIDVNQVKRNTVVDFWSSQAGNANQLLATNKGPLAVTKDNNILWLFDPGSLNDRFFLDAAFPVFAFRCFQFIGNSRFETNNYTVGQMVTSDTIVLPDGKSLDLNGNPYKLAEPGVYTLQWRSGSPEQIAVQPDIKESDYKPLIIPRNRNYHLMSNKWQDNLFLSRLGHDLWKYCLLAALFLFILEFILVKSEEWKKDTHIST